MTGQCTCGGGCGRPEDEHRWDLTAGQKAALRGRWDNSTARAKYRVAMFRRLGWRPLEAPKPTKVRPHSRCTCSFLCRSRLRPKPASVELQRYRWHQLLAALAIGVFAGWNEGGEDESREPKRMVQGRGA